MHLVYIDESGSSGFRLDDPDQPLLVLAALFVPAELWQALEAELSGALDRLWPDRPCGFEVHASELVNPTLTFVRQRTPADRMAVVVEWLTIARRHRLLVLHQKIDKPKYREWQLGRIESDHPLHPQVAAFALLACSVDSHLARLPAPSLGLLIVDDNRQIRRDLDGALRLMGAIEFTNSLRQIVERGFFIESHRSPLLQLCDVCAYYIRRRALVLSGGYRRPYEDAIFALLAGIAPDSPFPALESLPILERLEKLMRPGA